MSQSETANTFNRVEMSQNLRGSLQRAMGYAAEQSHRHVTLEHLLLALADDREATVILEVSAVDVAALLTDVSDFLGRLEDRDENPSGQQPAIGDDISHIIQSASAAAQKSQRREIGSALVLAAIVGDGRSPSAQMLRNHGLTFENAIKALRQANAASRPPPSQPAADAARQPSPATIPVAAPMVNAIEQQAAPRQPSLQNVQAAHDIIATARERIAAARGTVAAAEALAKAPPHTTAPLSAQADPQALDQPAAPSAVGPAHAVLNEPRDIQEPATPRHPARASELDPGPGADAQGRPAKSPVNPRQDTRTPQTPPVKQQPARPAPRHVAAQGPTLSERLPPREVIESHPGHAGRQPNRHPAHHQIGAQHADQPVLRSPPTERTHPPAHGAGPPRGPVPRPAEQPVPIQPQTAHQTAHPARPPTRNPYAPPNDPAQLVPPSQPGRRPDAYPHTARARQPAPGAPATRDANLPAYPFAQQQHPHRQLQPGEPPRPQVRPIEPEKLVEGIPRRMRVGLPATVEVRTPRAGLEAWSGGMQGHHNRDDQIITKAMAMCLSAPDHGFTIELASPETQWSAGAGPLSDDVVSWRWIVTPVRSGRHRLQLSASTRVVARDGLAAARPLPEQTIIVRVRPNYVRTAGRTAVWIMLLASGLAIGYFGEQILLMARSIFSLIGVSA